MSQTTIKIPNALTPLSGLLMSLFVTLAVVSSPWWWIAVAVLFLLASA